MLGRWPQTAHETEIAFDNCFPHKVVYGSTKGVDSITAVKNVCRQDGTRIGEHALIVALLSLDENVRVDSPYDSCNVPIRTRTQLSGFKSKVATMYLQ